MSLLGSDPSTQAHCVRTFWIEYDRMDVYIMPEVANCFSCALDTMGNVSWQLQVNMPDGEHVPVSLSPDAVTVGNFLVIAMPDDYVLPGTSGRRTIVCTSLVNQQTLEARLGSPSKNGISKNQIIIL